MIAPTVYLMDGSLSALPATRARKLEAMAGDLVAAAAYADRRDARLVLYRAGYASFDIEILIEDARALAVQVKVAEAIGDMDAAAGVTDDRAGRLAGALNQ